jgi:hypothetical protein
VACILFYGSLMHPQLARLVPATAQGPAELSAEEEAQLLALHDETIRYTREQLTALGAAAAPAKGVASSQVLWQQLPGDLRVP